MYIRLYNMLCKNNDNVIIFLSVLHGKYKLLTIILVGSSITTLLVPVRLVQPFSRYITDLCNEYNLNVMDLQPRLTSKKRSLGQKRDSV